ncbi:MAG: double-strand break repair helicase AddA [Rhizomicrobium sp.]
MSGAFESASPFNPAISAWVSAHAGTGKTYTLANRVTSLLLDGAAPERILCLTYTKAAAGEMAGRLFGQLGEWAMLDDAALAEKIASVGACVSDAEGLARARRLFALALEAPGGLKIQTIHSFCQYLLARFPLEAGVPPSFDVLDEETAAELVAGARARVLERAGAGEPDLAEAVNLLATQAGEGKLDSILSAALGGDRRKFERFLERLERDCENIATAVARAHGIEPGTSFESVEAGFCGQMRTARNELEKIAAWLSDGKKTDAKLGEALRAALASGRFDDFRAVFSTAGGTPRARLATNDLVAANGELHARFRDAANRFYEAEQRCRAARAAALALAALTLARAVCADYACAKRTRGMLDYDDLIAATLRLLERREAAAWVLYKLDGGLDHILIDEAQDTSPEQWRIILRLAGEFFAGEGARSAHAKPRTLFVVGDEKQSIFSFQGADPSQFAINREYFGRIAGNRFVALELVRSRRSAQAILDCVDVVFADEAVREGVSSSPIRHETAREGARGHVFLWPTVKPVEEPLRDLWQAPVDLEPEWSPVFTLADQIASRIAQWTDGRQYLPGHTMPISPGDIMVLMPRREPFASALIRCLKQRGVRVAGADRIRLLDQIAVMDLVALGRFSLLPEDDLNLAALLRSPLIGFSEDELYGLAVDREGSLWRALEIRREETAAYSFAHELLAKVRARADFTPPFEFYAQALGQEGGRKRLLARLGAESNDAIDEFLSLALAFEKLNTPALETFLGWLESGDTEIRRDMERGRDQVRVMTVHGAKGLEADIVILPDTTTIPRSANRHAALLYDGDDVFFPLREEQAPDCVRRATLRAREEALREHRRLLYVALTRARDELHICGFETKRGVLPGSWYDLVGRMAHIHGWAIGEEDSISRETRSATRVHDGSPAPLALPPWAGKCAPKEEAHTRLIRPSDAADGEAPARDSPRGETRFARGLLVHALLARLPELGGGERVRAARRYLAARGLADDAREALIEETLAVIDNPVFAEAFAPGESRAEVALVADLPELGAGTRINGRIDRLAVTAERVLAVDFKSNRPAPATVADVAPLYVGQMALYRAALARMFPGRRIDCALLWTEGPSLMALPANLLDAEIARMAARLDRSRCGS